MTEWGHEVITQSCLDSLSIALNSHGVSGCRRLSDETTQTGGILMEPSAL
jgi:hypothetical protein